jgi:hypothetical protein
MHGRSGGSGEPARVNASSIAWFGLGPDPRRALGQRPSVPHQQGQEVFYVDAALVGCGHALSQLRVHVWTAPGIEIPQRSSPLPYQGVLFLSVGSTGGTRFVAPLRHASRQQLKRPPRPDFSRDLSSAPMRMAQMTN